MESTFLWIAPQQQKNILNINNIKAFIKLTVSDMEDFQHPWLIYIIIFFLFIFFSFRRNLSFCLWTGAGLYGSGSVGSPFSGALFAACLLPHTNIISTKKPKF